MNEFELIDYFFAQTKKDRDDVLLGIGDDGALLKVPPRQSLVVSMDTLVEGIHFPVETTPYDIGYKALAVNLSDLAAMGAKPAWATLALTLPKADKDWLKKFSRGFFSLLNHYGMQLVGGDTTRGPLAITVQVHGFVPFDRALRRDQAKPGDLIYVTGTLGDAGAGLNWKIPYFLQRLNRPEPRVEVGLALRGISHCAIDISDGLAADLGHILQASKVGAQLFVEQLPLSQTLTAHFAPPKSWQFALNSGDDYELCFTVPPKNKAKLHKALTAISCGYTCIGVIRKKPGLFMYYNNGKKCISAIKGYKHF